MKKTDVAMIIFIASIAVMAAFAIASNVSFLRLSEKGESVPTIEVVSSTIEKPDPKVFNSNAVNPTVETFIGK